ncbi:phosphoribosylaminoimidazole-succinocarboxamide synthase [Microbacterium invictum]|uniref:Phosphoribosylaminoimidazole-succinocarboxamide synthase n=3 Tax=Microbacterium invictum TaxID=515415 RepID=A0AA40VN40_9MICO|nr:phosphoribosylaminoimidazole-succinocarboxamide synthase [Microbacterium invictum]
MPSLGDIVAPRRMGVDFRWLLASSWTSNVGDGIALAAAPLLIASMTSSPVLVASGAILQFLPWLLFGLHAGAVADRFDRRRIMMLANGARAVVVAALIVFLVTGVANIGIVLAVAFLYGCAEVFVDTAGSAMLPMIVKPVDLGTGNARLQAGFLVANQFAGPPLGAFLFALGSAWPFLVQGLCVALAIVLISRLTLPIAPPAAPAPRKPVHTDIGEGLQWLWRNPPVRTLVLIILCFNITWAAPWGVLVLYATEHLGMGPVGFGALTTASALGGMLAVLIFGRLQQRVSFATLMRVCLSAEVVMHLSFALTTTGWVALVIMFGFGLYAFVWGTISTTVRQRLVPQALQGRVASVNMVGVFGGMVIGQALGGVIAQTWGLTAPWWFAFAGSALTLALVWRPISHIVNAPPAMDNGPVTDAPDSLPGWTHVYSGKVRDLYRPADPEAPADRMLVVASDRVSAFDFVLEPAIPDKGTLLTTLSLWWFDQLSGGDGGRRIPNHLAASHELTLGDDGIPNTADDLRSLIPDAVAGRAMLVRALDMQPIECVVRGYLTGSGWVEYQDSGTVCGIALPAGLANGDRLPEPIFTPAFKAPLGEHDENISYERTVELVGADVAAQLRDTSLEIYTRAARIAEAKGLILADTKFEFGLDEAGTLTLADEVLTSDSSRYWDAEAWRTGTTPSARMASFDKQRVRDWLAANWDKQGTPPALPGAVVAQTTAKYRELLQRLTA